MNKEKVRELATELRENTIPSGYENVITEWLEQNQPEPVVVGLSEEQVFDLAKKILVADAAVICATIGTYSSAISEWLKTQTFAQPEKEIITAGLNDEQNYDVVRYVDELEKELEQLKSQQLKPNWDDAPDWAIECLVRVHWIDKNGHGLASDILYRVPRPTPPAPKVEVGQVWKCAKTDVEVIALNDDDVVFQKRITKGFDVYSLEDFLDKFELVNA